MNSFGTITVRECVTAPAPADPRCGDPAFAALNPSICAATPKLLIKPGAALICAFGSIQFKAFLVTNGSEEDVSADCVWQTSNQAFAVIGATSGNATGLSAGEPTVSAAYENYTATADLTVMGTTSNCCNEKMVGMMLLVDKSISMSQAFGSSYSTRLDFAKAAAARFVSEIDPLKDMAGLISFDDNSFTLLDSPSGDIATVEDNINSIQQDAGKTSFYAALEKAIEELDSAGPDLKVIVLFSDGEDTGVDAENDYVDGNNPVTLLTAFKDSGGVVICMGARASGGGFALLSALATGGFFINGVPDNEAEALDYLSGLKGYICAGNCTPAGDVIVGEGTLAYASFAKWDVSGGDVDLLGNGFFDLLPGNGLYVDLASGAARMVTKTAIPLVTGHQYRLSARIAGNQRQAGTPYSVTFQVFYKIGDGEVPLLSQTVLVTDYAQPFTNASFTFTAPFDTVAYISIKGSTPPSGNNANWGLLLDQVKFDDATDHTSLLLDTFDGENQVFVPPACGQSSLYEGVYGYNCYGAGCLEEPPSSQSPDPSPLPNIESGGYVPPASNSSTQTQCASCTAGYINQDPDDELGTSDTQLMTISPAAVAAIYYWSGTVSDADYAANVDARYEIVLQGSNNGTTWTTINTQYSVRFFGSWGGLNEGGRKAIFTDNATAYSRYRLVTTPALPASFATTAFDLFKASAQSICKTATVVGSSPGDAQTRARAEALALAQAELTCIPAWTATEQVALTCPAGTTGPIVRKSATVTSLTSQSDAEAQAIAQATLPAQAEIDANCIVGGGGGSGETTYWNEELPYAAGEYCTYAHYHPEAPPGSVVPQHEVTVYIFMPANRFWSLIDQADANARAIAAAQPVAVAWIAYYCKYPYIGTFTVRYGTLPP